LVVRPFGYGKAAEDERTAYDWRVDDAWHRMMFAADLDSRLLWALRLTQAKRERGIFNGTKTS
jgi:hypothetical protein